jgi:hypothetical protein
MGRRMAAVFCFIFLFALAAIALLLQPFLSGASAAGIVAFVLFSVLASGVFVALFKMAKKWEAEAGPEH